MARLQKTTSQVAHTSMAPLPTNKATAPLHNQDTTTLLNQATAPFLNTNQATPRPLNAKDWPTLPKTTAQSPQTTVEQQTTLDSQETNPPVSIANIKNTVALVTIANTVSTQLTNMLKAITEVVNSAIERAMQNIILQFNMVAN